MSHLARPASRSPRALAPPRPTAAVAAGAHRRRRRAGPVAAPLAVLALALAADVTPAGATPTFIAPGVPAQSLAHGNANKIVVGRANILHAVYTSDTSLNQSSSGVYYTSSLDGQSWTPPKLVSPVGTTATSPSLAVDSIGRPSVTWVANPDGNGVGAVYYSHRVSGVWISNWLNAHGAEPASIAVGLRVYLTWTELGRVRYTDRITNGSPSPLRTVAELPTACPGSSFRQPAIALVSDPCKAPIVRIGYLFVSDQQDAGGACTLPDTQIGPRVSQLDNATNTWSVVYDGVQTSSQNPGTVQPISLSMSANFASGSTVLAWSDVQNGAARTRLAMRQPAGWVSAPFDNQKHHVHVRAASGLAAPPADFRLGWSGSSSNPYFAALSYWRDATWTGATPSWGPATLIDNDASSTGRPQPLAWKRCQLGVHATTNVAFEAQHSAVLAATDFSLSAPCPPPSAVPGATPCPQLIAQTWSFLLDGGGGKGAILDLSDFGLITELGAGWAVARAPSGKVARATWSSGAVLASSDTTLTLSAPPEALTITGEGFSLPVQHLGHLADYDELVR